MKFIKIYPMGGIEEIGANCTCYWTEKSNIFVDFGICLQTIDDITPYNAYYMDIFKFAVDMNFSTINIVITHCHEDHIGAIGYIEKQMSYIQKNHLSINIYVSGDFNEITVKRKCKYILNFVKIYNIPILKQISIGGIEIIFMPVDHSALNCNGLIIKYNNIKIFHTGDWKFYHHPLSKDINNSKTYQTIQQIKSCDILVNESTRIGDPYYINNEDDVINNLEVVIKKYSNRSKIFITMFSSNIDRVKSILKIAALNNYTIDYMSTSLKNNIYSAYSTGYISSQEYARLKYQNTVEKLIKSENKIKIVSGCQNEPNSVLNKISNTIEFINNIPKGSVFIFSSNIIPSLRKRVEYLYRSLDKNNMEILNIESYPNIHSSGHASYEEMKFLYKYLKPTYSIPIHGDISKINSHLMLIKEVNSIGIKPHTNKYFEFNISEDNKISYKTLSFQNNTSKKIIINTDIVDETSPIIKERKNLILGGIIIICSKTLNIQTIGTRISQKQINTIKKCISNNMSIINIKKIASIQGELIIV